MFAIDATNKIKMVQGDTGSIRLQLSNYALGPGDEVRFGLTARNIVQPQAFALARGTGEDLLIEKVITEFEDDGSAIIYLDGEDTLHLNPGQYLYEVQVKTSDGRIDTVITTTRFTILEGIIYG